jgi:heme-degrading monooxygenase HmoA
MIVTVFRSRVRPENAAEYMKMAEKMKQLASAMPGYIGHKGFTAEDGERCTIVEFESEETHRAWAELPAHRKAQQLGRERFYSEFSIHVCNPLRSNSFKLSAEPHAVQK